MTPDHLHYLNSWCLFQMSQSQQLITLHSGDSPETMKSIKYNAPRDYSTQDRAVTVKNRRL